MWPKGPGRLESAMTIDNTQRESVIARLMEKGLTREAAEARLDEHLAKKAADAKAAEAPTAPVIPIAATPATDATPAPEPKRRGRPPKAKPEVDPNAPPPVPKRRGRPPKAKVEPDPNAPAKRRGRPPKVKPEPDPNAPPPVPKRRGRPPKVGPDGLPIPKPVKVPRVPAPPQKPASISFTVDEWNAIDAKAKAEGVSFNKFIRAALATAGLI